MKREEFIKYVKNIGFKIYHNRNEVIVCAYKDYRIFIGMNFFRLVKEDELVVVDYFANTSIIDVVFNKEFRSFKIKQLLK